MDPGFLVVIGMFAIFYFLVLRPQQQEQKAHDELIAGLSKDDQVVTASGVHGRVVAVAEVTLDLEVAKNTRITIDKHSVQRKADTTSAT